MLIKLKQIVVLAFVLCLTGCFNKKNENSEVVFRQARHEYKQGKYGQVTKLLNEFEFKFPDSPSLNNAILLSANAHYELGYKKRKLSHLTEAIKLYDFIDIMDPEFANKNDIYYLRIKTYHATIPAETEKCVDNINKTLEYIDQYQKSPNNTKYKKEIESIKKDCIARLISYRISRAKQNHADFRQVDALYELNQAESNCESLYRRLLIRLDMNCNNEEIIYLLNQIDNTRKSNSDSEWLDKALFAIEKADKKFSIKQKAQIYRIKQRLG